MQKLASYSPATDSRTDMQIVEIGSPALIRVGKCERESRRRSSNER